MSRLPFPEAGVPVKHGRPQLGAVATNKLTSETRTLKMGSEPPQEGVPMASQVSTSSSGASKPMPFPEAGVPLERGRPMRGSVILSEHTPTDSRRTSTMSTTSGGSMRRRSAELTPTSCGGLRSGPLPTTTQPWYGPGAGGFSAVAPTPQPTMKAQPTQAPPAPSAGFAAPQTYAPGVANVPGAFAAPTTASSGFAQPVAYQRY
mmetsp:Transcript_79761/g.222012  ORF Transcript_79761/g.222012 Transcript_79761/m.222012 type:complete len:204 (-) Transcript_79761:105-716(-)